MKTNNPTRSRKSSRLPEKVHKHAVIRWLAPVVVAMVSCVLFLPALWNGFVEWDDYENIVNNPHYRGLGWSQLRWMFTTFHHSLYRPFTWISLGLDYIFWGMNPLGYHLTSVLLHAANAVLVFYLAQRLLTLRHRTAVPGRDLPVRIAAAFAALIFAVHPLRVEPVAWVSARNDLLSAFFFLLTIIFYLEYARRKVNDEYRLGHWFAATVAAYACSLLSKASGITLPLVLLVLDVYPLGRLGKRGWFGPAVRKVWWEKLPFFFLAVITALAAVVAKYKAGSIASVENYGFSVRAVQSLYGLSFYIWKTLLPLKLSPLYQVPPDFTGSEPWALASASWAAILFVILFVLRSRWPAGLASLLCYVAILAPVLGFFQSGPQLAADRYSYLSCMSWALLAGGGLVHLWQLSQSGRFASRIAIPVTGVAAVALVALGALTWKQTQIWKDSERLWRHALSIQKDSVYAHNNLGMALAEQKRLDEAIVEFREVLQIDPRDADGHHNLGNALARKGRLGEAVEQFHEALRIRPDHAKAHYDLGNALARQGELDSAVLHFRQAVRYDPRNASAHYNAGRILLEQRQLEEATDHFRQALRIDATHMKARYYLAVALAGLGDFGAADKEFREALRVEPNLAEAHAGLARALSAQGKKDEAVQHYQEAVRLLKSQSQNMNEGSNK
jgi:protein O-mannosyl-transferase